MEMQASNASKSSARVILIANIAIMIFCLAGIPVIMGWIPSAPTPFSDSAFVLKPGKQSASTVEHAVRKIPAAPGLAPSDTHTQANNPEYAAIEPAQEGDISDEDHAPVTDDNAKVAPSPAFVPGDISKEK